MYPTTLLLRHQKFYIQIHPQYVDSPSHSSQILDGYQLNATAWGNRRSLRIINTGEVFPFQVDR